MSQEHEERRGRESREEIPDISKEERERRETEDLKRYLEALNCKHERLVLTLGVCDCGCDYFEKSREFATVFIIVISYGESKLDMGL